MTMLAADPSVRRQIDASNPWVFWRDAPDGRGRQGFACALSACGNPDCPCTEVGLTGMIVDDRLVRVGVVDNRLDCRFDARRLSTAERTDGASRNPGSVRIDFQTGEVLAEDGVVGVADDLRAWLASEVDGELLDRLHERWFAFRGYEHPDWRVADWSWWQPWAMVSYGHAFPTSRGDEFVLRGEGFLVEDMHCIDPECDCTQVRIVFARLREDAQAANGRRPVRIVATEEGALRVNLPSLAPQVLKREEGLLTDPDLFDLWQRYCARHGDLATRLAARRQRMKSVRPQDLRRVAPNQRVGRNAPCPCGSGAKFKKCCLERERGALP